MKQYLNKILREKIKRNYFKKNEIKKKILKFLITSKHVPKLKKYFITSFFFKKTKNNVSKQKLICLLTGRQRGIRKFVSLSRHTINKFNLEAKINPISTKSW